MSDKKITDCTELTTPASGDYIPIVDVSDTTDDAAGTSKKILTSAIDNVINVKRYGATGDGSSDDTVAINAAITAATTNGNTVYFPAGTYRFTSTLALSARISLLGENRYNTKLDKDFNGTGIEITISHTKISSITLDNTNKAVNGDTSYGIYYHTNGSRGILENIRVINQGSHGIYHTYGNLNTFRDIISASNDGTGIYVSGADTNACVFENIDVNLNGGDGMYVDNISIYVLGLTAQNNTGYGLSIAGNYGNYSGVYTETNTAGSVHLEATADYNFIVFSSNHGITDDTDATKNNSYINSGSTTDTKVLVLDDLYLTTAGNINLGNNTSTLRKITFGSGSPEGVLTALIGSLYLRTDGGAGTTLYIKESGTDASGWVAK